jgi:hypothetical protein
MQSPNEESESAFCDGCLPNGQVEQALDSLVGILNDFSTRVTYISRHLSSVKE